MVQVDLFVKCTYWCDFMDSFEGIIVISEGDWGVISWSLLVRDEEVVVYTLVVSLIEITGVLGGREVLFTAENVEFAFHLYSVYCDF